MLIQISEVTTQETAAGTRKYFTAIADNKEVSFSTFKSSKSDYSYVNVIYKNASHKAYRGTGKDFNDLDEALENYKDSKIRACIQAAKDAFNGTTIESSFFA